MKQLLAASVFAGLAAGAVQASDEVTLQLKWVTQAQFAGYYVALDKGFYDEADLDVTILPGGPDIAPTQVIAGGGADGAGHFFSFLLKDPLGDIAFFGIVGTKEQLPLTSGVFHSRLRDCKARGIAAFHCKRYMPI